MADKKHALRLPKDCFNRAEISQEYFSPVCEFSAANEYLSSPTCTTPETSKKEFLYETPNNNVFETPKKIFEGNENELSQNNNDSSNSTFISEMDFIRPKYYNNVSPAIEKIMHRMMKMPISSTPEKSQTPTKRVFSPNYRSVGKANEDPAIWTLTTRKRLDASFSSPKAHAIISREHSMDSPTLKATLAREIEPPLPQIVQASSRCQEFVDSFPDERVACCKDIIYVSEMHVLLMASNRNRRMRMAASRRRSRSDSRDSAFSEFMGSDQEYLDGEVHQQ